MFSTTNALRRIDARAKCPTGCGRGGGCARFRPCPVASSGQLPSRPTKLLGGALPQVVRFVLTHTGLRAGLAERFRATLEIFQRGQDISRELIQTRCQRGADIAHHERLDGKGHPRGLQASQIEIETRIITTADIFDAISADRPYRAAVPVARTLEMMRRLVGSALDESCMDALRDVAARVEQDLGAQPQLAAA